MKSGKVWLVGAGPGDAELLTLKAARALAEADVVAYDELISEEILAMAPPSAERIPVGRRANGCRYHEDKIHPVVIERALAGKIVVRLKGGDPMVFGRGGEEAEELAAAGVPFEALAPLTRTAVANTFAQGPRQALTGPIARRDWETVRGQFQAVAQAEPDRSRQFRLMAEATAVTAKDTLAASLTRPIMAWAEGRAHLRLDWFAGRGWQGGSGATVRGLDGPGRASDHAPLVADFW